MLIVAGVFTVIAFAFLGFVIYLTKQDQTKVKKKKQTIGNDDSHIEDEFDNKVNQSKLKKLINIDKVKNNKVYLRNGAVRVVLSLSSPDFELLTDEEQMTFENCLMMLALSLNTPIMFHTTLKKMEIKEPAEDVEKVINSSDEYISENLKNYCSSLYVSYKKIAEEKGVYVRKSYCVVGAYLPDKKEDKILNELQSRVDIIAGGLSRASMKVNLMNSVQAVQLYADLFNKGKGLKVDELEKNGLLDLYSEGVGQVDII